MTTEEYGKIVGAVELAILQGLDRDTGETIIETLVSTYDNCDLAVKKVNKDYSIQQSIIFNSSDMEISQDIKVYYKGKEVEDSKLESIIAELNSSIENSNSEKGWTT